jgi:hypothetical protein
MTYCRWDDLVTGHGHAHLLIAEVQAGEPLPPPQTHQGAIRELIVAFAPVGDFALRAESDREVQIAFEKADDASRIAALLGARSAARRADFGSSWSFKYEFKA